MIVIRVEGTLSDRGEARPFTPARLDELRAQWRRDHPEARGGTVVPTAKIDGLPGSTQVSKP